MKWETKATHSPRHVSRAGDNLRVVHEAAAWKVACVAGKLSADTHISFARL